MNADIQNIRLKFNCAANWDKMTPMAGGRFCDHCAKIVYDFTDVKQAEFARVMTENSNGFCGRFRAEQMAPKPALPRWRQWLPAAMLLISTGFLTQCKRDYQNEMITLPEKSDDLVAPIITMGMPLPPYASPEFVGGEDALVKFITKNIQFPKGYEDVSGKVFVRFDINEDGSADDFKIMKGAIEPFNKEALRVLKLMPKWRPALSNGKAVKSTYTIPINFTISVN